MHLRQRFPCAGSWSPSVILAAGLLSGALPALARTSPDRYLETYFDLKEKHGVATDQSEGAVEARGIIRGKIQSGGTMTWIISDESGEEAKSYQFASGEDLPEFSIGMQVRALGRGLAAPGARVALALMVSESEIAAWEASRVQRSPASPPRQPPSRVIVFQPPAVPGRAAVPSPAAGAPAPPASASVPPPAASDPPAEGEGADPPGGPEPPRWREVPGSAPAPAEREAAARPQRLSSRSISDYLARYRQAVRHFNPRLSSETADTIARSILAYSAHYRIDPRLVVAVIAVESGFKPSATSHKGAMGLGQLMPGTAAGLGVSNAYDPVENIGGAVRLLRGHLAEYTGKPFWEQLALALACYNAGSGAVKRHGGVPPYRETQSYIRKVGALYAELCGLGKRQ